MGRPVTSAVDLVNNWKQNFGAAGPKWLKGIGALTQSPTAAAATADAQARYLQGVQRVVADGSMAAKLNAYTLPQFQAACKAKAGNLTQGAAIGAQNLQAKSATMVQAAQAARDAVANMPKGGAANATARFQAAMAATMQAWGKS